MIRWQSLVVASVVAAVSGAPAAALAASTITYTYDVFGQLVTANSTAGRSVTYTYDAAGNRTNMAASGAIALNAPAPQAALLQVSAQIDGRDPPKGTATQHQLPRIRSLR